MSATNLCLARCLCDQTEPHSIFNRQESSSTFRYFFFFFFMKVYMYSVQWIHKIAKAIVI